MGKWILKRNNISALAKELGLKEVTVNILYNRGIKTKESIEKFLNGSLGDLHDPRLMQDSQKAVEIIIGAIKNKEQIVVYTDYDCDGVGAAVILIELLRKLNAKVNFYSNNRFIDGYGLCKNGIDNILRMYPEVKLIITCDNGIVAFEGIEYAKAKGLKVIVTDHHDPDMSGKLPPADAVVNPRRLDDTYPFKGLCGAGVVFKLMLLLYFELGKDLKDVYDTLDVCALSTVGDVVPLIDENRIIVKEGLRYIKDNRRAVFEVLQEKFEAYNITAHYTLGFLYAPLINAVGRIDGQPDRAIRLFFLEDKEEIKKEIDYLYNLNEQRKEMTKEQEQVAIDLLKNKGLKEVIVLYHPRFHLGIVGLIAGRLKEIHNRPCVVFAQEGNVLKGSGRSIDNFNMKEVFTELKHLTIAAGGHAKAGGITILPENLEAFEEAIIEIAKNRLTQEDYIKKYIIDYRFFPNTIDLDILDELDMLQPYGEGFEEPLFLLDNFVVDDFRVIGEEQRHLKLINKDLAVILWNEAEWYSKLGRPKKIRALGIPQSNVFNNKVYLQFVVKEKNLLPA